MDIYAERIKLGTLRNIRWFRPGQFCSRLVGINIVQQEEQVTTEPVYLPLISIDRDGSVTFIELATNKPLLLIVLFPQWPFIHIERTNVIHLEDE